MIEKVISGGNTGADQAGLIAAVAVDICTGGWACKGWMTEVGAAPWLKEYGLRECVLDGYGNRTVLNVRDSTGTVIFGGIDKDKYPGSRLTFDTCSKYRPCLHFDVVGGEIMYKQAEKCFREWVKREGIKVLNVAGNRESKNPGIHEAVVGFLLRVL